MGANTPGVLFKTGENALSGAMGTRPSCGVGIFMHMINRIDLTLTLPQNFELTQVPGDQETKKTGRKKIFSAISRVRRFSRAFKNVMSLLQWMVHDMYTTQGYFCSKILCRNRVFSWVFSRKHFKKLSFLAVVS